MLGTDSDSPWSLQTLSLSCSHGPRKCLKLLCRFFWEGPVPLKCTIQKLGPSLSTLALTQGSRNFLSRGQYLFWHLELEEGLVKEKD